MASKGRLRSGFPWFGRGEGDSPVFPAGKPGQSPALVAAVLAVALGCLTSSAPARADDPLDQRREEIAGMDQAEKERLRRNYERFVNLDPDEQERIRRLHEDIESDPNADELRQVMDRYYQWLKKLSPYERAQLQDLPPAERIERISKLCKEEEAREAARTKYVNLPRGERIKLMLMRDPRSRFLTGEDVETLFRWIEESGPKYKARFLESMSEDRRRQWREEPERAKDPKRQHEMSARMWLRLLMDSRGKLPPGLEDEMDRLTAKFSESTRKRLESMSEDERRQTIARWVGQVILVEFMIHRAGPPLPGVGEEELAEFLETELDPRQRAELLSLPGDEMQRQLKFMYLRSKMPDGFSLPSGGEWRRLGTGGFGPFRGGPGGGGGRRPSPGGFGRGGRQGPGGPRPERGGLGPNEPPRPPGGHAPNDRPKDPRRPM